MYPFSLSLLNIHCVTSVWVGQWVLLYRVYSIPRSSIAFLLISWYRSAMTTGVTPSFSAVTVMGVPCWSDPPTISTSSPKRRWYLLNMSGGSSEPATCPRCIGPLA